MQANEEPLQDLQREFYLRAQADLSRYKDMVTSAGRVGLTGEQVNLFIATMAMLDLEAKTLEVSVVFRHRLSNLSRGPAPAPLSDALWLIKYYLNPNAAKEFRSADK